MVALKCNKCHIITNDYYNIVNNIYCLSCLDKYMLHKCPGQLCFNIISLTEHASNICCICDTIMCDFCVNTYNKLLICKYCHNNKI